jgi:hypothetical protein
LDKYETEIEVGHPKAVGATDGDGVRLDKAERGVAAVVGL